MACNNRADTLKKSNELESRLKGKLFLGGTKPSAEDVKLFNELLGGNQNLFRWVKHIASFPDAERKGWGAPVKITPPVLAATGTHDKKIEAKATTSTATAAAAPKVEPKKVEPPKAAAAKAAAADDDVDLFGEETEEDKAAMAAKKASDEEKKKEKKAVIAKSSILIDIKPWDDETNLEDLAKELKAVQRDGLLWGQHKLAPVAFGLKKLQILVVIEDDKISGDDLEDLIMGFDKYVQSMDIQAWNKV